MGVSGFQLLRAAPDPLAAFWMRAELVCVSARHPHCCTHVVVVEPHVHVGEAFNRFCSRACSTQSVAAGCKLEMHVLRGAAEHLSACGMQNIAMMNLEMLLEMLVENLGHRVDTPLPLGGLL